MGHAWDNFPVWNMPQDRQSGVEASRYGHICTRLIAKAIEAEMVGKKSNECIWNGQPVVIKPPLQDLIGRSYVTHG